MVTPVIAFFNNKGGVGKTSLVYHLAWMFADLGIRVVAADLDPQANLTAAFLDEDRLEEIWEDEKQPTTIFRCVSPLMEGTGDIASPRLELIDDRLALLVGDLSLSEFEDQLSEVWPKCMDRDKRSFRVISAFWRTIQNGAASHQADIILLDLGPNLGAMNRATLIATDYVVVPLSPDLFSLQGLRNLGPRLRRWRGEWQERLEKNPIPETELELPGGQMQPIGYVVLQHSMRLDRPMKAYQKWINRIPQAYRKDVLDEDSGGDDISIVEDPNCLALIKNYQSLMPMAQEARKPIFHLKPADGAIGAHVNAVRNTRGDFEKLARAIMTRAQIIVDNPDLHLSQLSLL